MKWFFRFQGASILLHALLFGGILAMSPSVKERTAPVPIEIVHLPPAAPSAPVEAPHAPPIPHPSHPRHAMVSPATAAHASALSRTPRATEATPSSAAQEISPLAATTDAAPDPGVRSGDKALSPNAEPAPGPALGGSAAQSGMAVAPQRFDPAGGAAIGSVEIPRAIWQPLVGDATGTQILDTAPPLRIGGQIVDDRSDALVGRAAQSSVEPNRTSETVYFPGFGQVRTDRVCLGADGRLKAVINAYDKNVCDPRQLDKADPSQYPMKSCKKIFTPLHPPKVIEAPTELAIRECVKRDYSGSYAHPTCLEWREGTLKQRLDFREVQYLPDDFRHLNPIRSMKKTVPRCPEDSETLR